MSRIQPGLYEMLVTEALEARLRELDAAREVKQDALRKVEAADRIAMHLARVIQRSIAALDDDRRVVDGVALARKILELVDRTVEGAEAALERLVEPAAVLRAVLARLPDGRPEPLSDPLIPLLDTTLLTNSPGEPRVGNQIQTEIHSADRIDLVMAFIRRSGIRPLLDALRAHAGCGRPLRVLTTTYTGSTEGKALDELSAAGAEVRVSYDATSTRLHAKAWLFHRDSGFSTAYIGSSNLTHSAQVSGLEWNVRVSGARNPDVIDKVAAVFETYWNSGDFVAYERDEFERQTESTTPKGSRTLLSPIELRPEPFQERMLEQIALARQRGHHRNLLVSATGTGKTVMAAVDYARLRIRLPRARLLFVAHREEILEQSLATFRYAIRDAGFGEMWVGGRRPSKFEHVFASIQSLGASGFAHIDPKHFDIVVIDEFHHAAAPSYRALLEHVQPVELLGLTATPERSDGLPVLGWFENRIAAELRLWDAIDQHRLSPFAYFGIHDGSDLRAVAWRKGRGYDVEGLTNVLTADDALARLVLKRLEEHVDDLRTMRALGFCVSVEHARFMARVFRESGVPAVAVWADSSEADRTAALDDLADGRVRVVFSVDLFNEGVDVPAVDTLLLLRPTDSPMLFLQQLGRGLRRSPGKTACTVLDFVGRHRAEFRFDRRFRALLGGSRKELVRQVQEGFPYLPAGCHLELDRVASEVVLGSIREALPSRWPAKVEELRLLRSNGRVTGLSEYLAETGVELEDVYDDGKRSWSELCAAAGAPVESPGPHETDLRRACGRLLHIDDSDRIDAYRRFLAEPSPPDPKTLPELERRLLRMLVASVEHSGIQMSTPLEAGLASLWDHPQIRAELLQLLAVLDDRIEHVSTKLESLEDVPLRVHARYSRIEILAGFGVGDGAKVGSWQTGVRKVDSSRADLLAFTLDKTTGGFSPTTRYRDYAISRDLIHWESQSVTREASDTGQRYQRHVSLGWHILLFARLRASDRAFWFLGPATYVSHESEQPMAVKWRLRYPLPGDLFSAFAAAVA